MAEYKCSKCKSQIIIIDNNNDTFTLKCECGFVNKIVKHMENFTLMANKEGEIINA